MRLSLRLRRSLRRGRRPSVWSFVADGQDRHAAARAEAWADAARRPAGRGWASLSRELSHRAARASDAVADAFWRREMSRARRRVETAWLTALLLCGCCPAAALLPREGGRGEAAAEQARRLSAAPARDAPASRRCRTRRARRLCRWPAAGRPAAVEGLSAAAAAALRRLLCARCCSSRCGSTLPSCSQPSGVRALLLPASHLALALHLRRCCAQVRAPSHASTADRHCVSGAHGTAAPPRGLACSTRHPPVSHACARTSVTPREAALHIGAHLRTQPLPRAR
jgi:hypothetical protein